MNPSSMMLAGTVSVLGAIACSSAVMAQDVWPTANQATILVPFSPGGIADVPGRIIVDLLSQQTGTTFVLEHRPGAGGTLGTSALLEAASDGNTLLIVSSGSTIAPSLYPEVAPDPRTELKALSLLIDIPISIMVPADSDIESLEDLIETAQANPGQLSYGTGGVGSGNHLAAEMFQDMTGIELFHVPYAGASAATTGLLTGEVDMAFASIFESASQQRAGMARVLGVGSAAQLARYPDVPVISDTVPGYEAGNYFGLVGPADLGPAIVEEISAQLAVVAESPDALQTAENAGLDLVLSGPEGLQARFDVDVPRNTALIEELGLSK